MRSLSSQKAGFQLVAGKHFVIKSAVLAGIGIVLPAIGTYYFHKLAAFDIIAILQTTGVQKNAQSRYGPGYFIFAAHMVHDRYRQRLGAVLSWCKYHVQAVF